MTAYVRLSNGNMHMTPDNRQRNIRLASPEADGSPTPVAATAVEQPKQSSPPKKKCVNRMLELPTIASPSSSSPRHTGMSSDRIQSIYTGGKSRTINVDGGLSPVIECPTSNTNTFTTETTSSPMQSTSITIPISPSIKSASTATTTVTMATTTSTTTVTVASSKSNHHLPSPLKQSSNANIKPTAAITNGISTKHRITTTGSLSSSQSSIASSSNKSGVASTNRRPSPPTTTTTTATKMSSTIDSTAPTTASTCTFLNVTDDHHRCILID